MRVDVLTTFPGMFVALDESIVGRARARGALDLRVHDLRRWTSDRHRSTDDAPYGGGAGMVMRPEPFFAAVEELTADEPARVVALTPQGRVFRQSLAQELAALPRLVLLCGHYEGFDERVREHLVDDELSIGDYVLTGGELPAMVVIDAITRLLPGVLGSAESLYEESHSSGLLEYPHYTRPPEFRGWTVPDVLLSGNHAAIAAWRREQALLRTLRRRPELLARADLTSSDRRFLATNGAPEYLRPEDAEPPKRRRRQPRADGPGAPER